MEIGKIWIHQSKEIVSSTHPNTVKQQSNLYLTDRTANLRITSDRLRPVLSLRMHIVGWMQMFCRRCNFLYSRFLYSGVLFLSQNKIIYFDFRLKIVFKSSKNFFPCVNCELEYLHEDIVVINRCGTHLR